MVTKTSRKNSAKRLGQHDDESAADYLRRVVSNINYESEGMLDQLPNVEALLDFFDVWAAYDTDFWQGVLECIAEGDSPAKARAFVRKWNLGAEWLADIRDAVSARE